MGMATSGVAVAASWNAYDVSNVLHGTLTATAISKTGPSVMLVGVTNANYDGASTVSGVTINSVALTNIASATRTDWAYVGGVSWWWGYFSGDLSSVSAVATFGASQRESSMVVYSLTGAHTTSPVGGAGTSGTNTLPATQSVTVAAAGSLIFGAMLAGGSGAVTLEGTSTSAIGQWGAGTGNWHLGVYRTANTVSGDISNSLSVGTTAPTVQGTGSNNVVTGAVEIKAA